VVTRPMPVLKAEESHRGQPGNAENEGERVEGHGSRIYRGRETYPERNEAVRIRPNKIPVLHYAEATMVLAPPGA
jgi:hypothetical protein